MGPVVSARRRNIAPRPNWGKSAIKMTMIPMPPIQFVKLRHRSRLRGKTSRLGINVAPVPESPDTDSARLSRGLK